MLDFKITKNNNDIHLETSLTGKELLTISQLNKGTAFTAEERHAFGLKGKLPDHIETLEQQIFRAYQQFQQFETKKQKNIYLNVLHNTNQTLFYAIVKQHLTEMMPLIYTPMVGMRVKEYSREFRHVRGLYITHNDIDSIEEILNNRTNPEINLIVVTDGERVLGLGDQGVGGIEISVSKLMIYSLAGAIDPNHTLPIFLDVGTNNQELLNDPFYLGLRHPRITGQAYDDFIAAFVGGVKRKFPQVFLHWEDFGRCNAPRNLNRFRDAICSFNDDVQGTGIVALAALLSAVKKLKSKLTEQRIVIFGAGSAGTGVANQIYSAMIADGLSEKETRKCFWLVDKPGLITQYLPDLTLEQIPYARTKEEITAWQAQNQQYISLLEVIEHVKPTVLIGTSAFPGAFNETIVKTMAKYTARPIIFPLSNPNENSEATATDLINWTNNQVLIATGSPFDPVEYQGQIVQIPQCNNAFAFPGIGLGAISVKAKKVSDSMLLAAAHALSEWNLKDNYLIPPIDKLDEVAKEIALAVANKAMQEGLAEITENIEEAIEKNRWLPKYLTYKRNF